MSRLIKDSRKIHYFEANTCIYSVNNKIYCFMFQKKAGLYSLERDSLISKILLQSDTTILLLQ